MKEVFTFPEWIGYLGSITVAVSFMLPKLIWIRIVNLIGALIFIVYGYFIDKLPVILPNALIALIQLYYLTQALIRRLRA